jgi:cytoskeletal protein RodZ
VQDDRDHLGIKLQHQREKAGLSVADITFRTKIPRSVVEALEAGDFSVFSSPLYAKSFLSQYSAYLGVNAHAWLDALESPVWVARDVAAPILGQEEGGREKVPAFSKRPDSHLSTLILVALSLVLFYAGLKGYRYLEDRFGELDAVDQPVSPSGGAESRDEPGGAAEREPVIEEEAPPRAIIVR